MAAARVALCLTLWLWPLALWLPALALWLPALTLSSMMPTRSTLSLSSSPSSGSPRFAAGLPRPRPSLPPAASAHHWDFTNNVAGSHVFSTLVLMKGYYQVEMFPDDIPKTAIITPFGLFEFVRMPFGLWNAGSILQRLMDRVLAGLPFIFVYLTTFWL